MRGGAFNPPTQGNNYVMKFVAELVGIVPLCGMAHVYIGLSMCMERDYSILYIYVNNVHKLILWCLQPVGCHATACMCVNWVMSVHLQVFQFAGTHYHHQQIKLTPLHVTISLPVMVHMQCSSAPV